MENDRANRDALIPAVKTFDIGPRMSTDPTRGTVHTASDFFPGSDETPSEPFKLVFRCVSQWPEPLRLPAARRSA